MDNPLNKPFDKPKDPFFDMTGRKTPLNVHPYNPYTKAQVKESLTGEKVSNVLPGGRGLKDHTDSVDKGDPAFFQESGRVVRREQAQGKVVIQSNHPNKKINKIYG